LSDKGPDRRFLQAAAWSLNMTQYNPAAAAPARPTVTPMARGRSTLPADAALAAASRMRQAVLEEVAARLG